MKETIKSAGYWGPLLVAAAVLVLGFGGGLLVGRATREQRREALENNAEVYEHEAVQRVETQLAECRHDLGAYLTPIVPPPTISAATNAGGAVALGDSGRVDALGRTVEKCQMRKTLAKAYLCGSIERRIDMLDTIITQSKCADRAGIGDFIVNSFEACAEFTDSPERFKWEWHDFEEMKSVVNAQSHRVRYTKEILIDNVKGSHRRCREYVARRGD